MGTYFAADGNYGESAGLTIINTADFTDEDWEAIDSVSDNERASYARAIYRAK